MASIRTALEALREGDPSKLPLQVKTEPGTSSKTKEDRGKKRKGAETSSGAAASGIKSEIKSDLGEGPATSPTTVASASSGQESGGLFAEQGMPSEIELLCDDFGF